MSQRETTLLWLRDILEQLTTTQQRLEWTTDREASRVLTESMLRDLEQLFSPVRATASAGTPARRRRAMTPSRTLPWPHT